MAECIWCKAFHDKDISCDRVNMQDVIADLMAERDNYKEGLEVILKQEEALDSVDYIEPATIARAHLKVL